MVCNRSEGCFCWSMVCCCCCCWSTSCCRSSTNGCRSSSCCCCCCCSSVSSLCRGQSSRSEHEAAGQLDEHMAIHSSGSNHGGGCCAVDGGDIAAARITATAWRTDLLVFGPWSSSAPAAVRSSKPSV